MKIIKTFIATIFFILSATLVSAETNSPLEKLKGVGEKSGFNSTQSEQTALATNIGLGVKTFISLLGVIFIILIVYAGYTWMMAQGDDTKVQKAKSTIQRAVIGLIIAISSFAIWNLISGALINPK